MMPQDAPPQGAPPQGAPFQGAPFQGAPPQGALPPIHVPQTRNAGKPSMILGTGFCMFALFFGLAGGAILLGGHSTFLVAPGAIMFVIGVICAIFTVIFFMRWQKQEKEKKNATQQSALIRTLGFNSSGTQSAIVHPPAVGATGVYGPGAVNSYQGPPVHQGQPQAWQVQPQEYPQVPPVQYPQVPPAQYPQVPPVQYPQAGTPYPTPTQAPYPEQPNIEAKEPSAPPPSYDDTFKK
ncbi:uncharacterized protein [Asterias amurensis]|uniref:uncharacterized protein n=1 Tax=Asterias amurensis TaxID=7602 RepID=UPI003AB5E22A